MDEAWEKNRSAHVEYYTQSVEQHGCSHDAVGWGSQASQQKRFKVLTEIGLYPGASVLDIGCGIGDFFGYLTSQFNNQIDYLGMDITPKMVAAAKSKYPTGQFVVNDILSPRTIIPQADFVLASGIFALLDLDLDPYRVMRHLVEAMFHVCKVGIAFNSLSSWTSNVEPGKFFVDPPKALSMSRGITPWVVIRHDYLPHDFTVYMYRAQQRSMK